MTKRFYCLLKVHCELFKNLKREAILSTVIVLDIERHQLLQDTRLQEEVAPAFTKKHLVLLLTASTLKLVLTNVRNSLKVTVQL